MGSVHNLQELTARKDLSSSGKWLRERADAAREFSHFISILKGDLRQKPAPQSRTQSGQTAYFPRLQ